MDCIYQMMRTSGYVIIARTYIIGEQGNQFAHLRKDPKARQAFIMGKLSKELELTPDQKIKVEKIVEQTGAKRREFFLKNRPEKKKIMDEGFLQIKKELNNDQQKKLDVLKAEFEKRRKARDASRFHQ